MPPAPENRRRQGGRGRLREHAADLAVRDGKLEAALTAWVGEGRRLEDAELDDLIERFGLRPTVVELGGG